MKRQKEAGSHGNVDMEKVIETGKLDRNEK